MSNKRPQKKWYESKSKQYALLSLACPIATTIIVLIYQKVANADFWQNLATHPDPDNAHVAGGMIVAEIIMLFFWLVIACLVGIILAIIGLYRQKKWFGLGTAALLINGVPFLFLIFFYVRGLFRDGF
jgi:ABC-type phosphate transport system permease subunit